MCQKNYTFFQIAEADVDIFGGPVFSWVPPCARHEFMQVEDYPVYKWVVQKQTSSIFGFFPYYHGPTMQWVFQDYSANGYVAAPAPYNSQKKNGFAFRDGDFGRVYHCEN